MEIKIADIISSGGYKASDVDKITNLLRGSRKYGHTIRSTFRGNVVEGELTEILDEIDKLLSQPTSTPKATSVNKQNSSVPSNSINAANDDDHWVLKEDVQLSNRKEGAKFDLKGNRGRSMVVYEDRVVITVNTTFGSVITGNVSDGEKTIFFHDVIGVQYKASGGLIGYLQFETASGLMNNSANNMFNENTFTFDTKVSSNAHMRIVADYVIDQIAKYKQISPQSTAADEIKKYKDLFDIGAITSEEYEKKKKQLLNV